MVTLEEVEGREVARRQAAGDASASFNASTCSVPADLWPCHRQPGSPAAPEGQGVTVVPCAAGQLLLLSAATCQPRRGSMLSGEGGVQSHARCPPLGHSQASLFKLCISFAGRFSSVLTLKHYREHKEL